MGFRVQGSRFRILAQGLRLRSYWHNICVFYRSRGIADLWSSMVTRDILVRNTSGFRGLGFIVVPLSSIAMWCIRLYRVIKPVDIP